jgi:hypothetical protein
MFKLKKYKDTLLAAEILMYLRRALIAGIN